MLAIAELSFFGKLIEGLFLSFSRYTHFGVSVTYSRQGIWFNETSLEIRSSVLLPDYILQLKNWYKAGKYNSEMYAPSNHST